MSRTSKLKLFGGASAFALAVALGGAAMAAPMVSPDLAPVGRAEAGRPIGAGDPLVELMLRSGGRPTAARMSALLPSIIGPMTAGKAAALPALMEGIRGLGLGRDIEAAALDAMTGLVAGAGLEEGQAARLMSEIADRFSAKLQLAKVQNNNGTGKAGDKGKENNNNNGRGNGTYSG